MLKLFLVLTMTAGLVIPGTSLAVVPFTNTPLTVAEGDSEPAISIAANGTVGISGLQWLFDPNFFGTHYWSGSFGSTPTFIGLLDDQLVQPGKFVFGSGDADIDIGSSNALHATSLIFFINPPFINAQLGVFATRCSSLNSLGSCSQQFIDKAGSDRPWITSEGSHVYISYHDSKNSSIIKVVRSDDDGISWRQVGDPIVGQGGITGNSTFNNIQGPIVADPHTHNVYDIFAAGDTGVTKGRTFTPNHIYVSRSTDLGKHWTANLVYQVPFPGEFDFVFPALGVDPTNGDLYAVFSDSHHVYFSTSSDQGSHWSAPVTVNTAPANTAIFPWVAAYNGTVDVVYYGTSASSKDDSNAVWNVYLSQTLNNGASFTQLLVSNTPNHNGVICTEGSACPNAERTLLDLFEVAIDPQNGKAGVIYTDDTITQDNQGNPLPQLVLAYQN
jgi:BNR repeat protein